MPAGLSFSAITGTEGAIRRGGVVAATLASWSLLPGDAPGSWAFTARLQSVDAFHITQTPDTLLLVVGTARWRWSGVALEIGDGQVRATLTGHPEDV